MVFFHVDRHNFNAGNEVHPELATYEALLEGEKQDVEEMLNETSSLGARKRNP